MFYLKQFFLRETNAQQTLQLSPIHVIFGDFRRFFVVESPEHSAPSLLKGGGKNHGKMLGGEEPHPSEKYEFVRWNNEIPNVWIKYGKIQHLPKHPAQCLICLNVTFLPHVGC